MAIAQIQWLEIDLSTTCSNGGNDTNALPKLTGLRILDAEGFNLATLATIYIKSINGGNPVLGSDPRVAFLFDGNSATGMSVYDDPNSEYYYPGYGYIYLQWLPSNPDLIASGKWKDDAFVEAVTMQVDLEPMPGDTKIGDLYVYGSVPYGSNNDGDGSLNLSFNGPQPSPQPLANIALPQLTNIFPPQIYAKYLKIKFENLTVSQNQQDPPVVLTQLCGYFRDLTDLRFIDGQTDIGPNSDPSATLLARRKLVTLQRGSVFSNAQNPLTWADGSVRTLQDLNRPFYSDGDVGYYPALYLAPDAQGVVEVTVESTDPTVALLTAWQTNFYLNRGENNDQSVNATVSILASPDGITWYDQWPQVEFPGQHDPNFYSGGSHGVTTYDYTLPVLVASKAVLPRRGADRQPRGTPRINQSHPLAKRAKFLFSAGQVSEVVRGIIPTNSGTVPVPSTDCTAIRTGTSVGTLNYLDFQTINLSSAFSFVVRVKRNAASSGNYDSIAGTVNPSSNYFGFLVEPSGNRPYFELRSNNATAGVGGGGSVPALSTTSYETLIGVNDGVTLTMYRNGAFYASGTSPGFPGNSSGSTLRLGHDNRNGAWNAGLSCDISDLYIIDGALSSSEARSLSDNLYQIFESDAPRSFASASAVVAVSTSPVRYIRDTQNGSSVDPGSYWTEFNAFDAGGASLGPTATYTFSNAVAGTSSPVSTLYTDTGDASGVEISGAGVHWAMIDLGSVKDVSKVAILRYAGATFHGVKTEVSPDGITWYTVFDSTASGEYVEPAAPRNFTLPAYTYTPVTTVNLVAAPSAQANASSTSVIARTVGLTAATTTQGNASGVGVESQIHLLATVASSQANSASTGTLSVIHSTGSTTSTQSNASSTAAVTRVVSLTGATSVQSATTATNTVAVTKTLTGATSTQSNSASTAVIARTIPLTAAATSQGNVSGAGTLTAVKNLVGTSSTQSNTTATAVAGAAYVTAGGSSSQANTSGTGAATQVVILSAATSTQGNSSLATGVTGAGTLQPSTSSQANSSSTGTVGVTRTLSGASSTQGGSSGTAAVTMVVALVPVASTQASASSTATVTQVQVLTGTTSVQSATSGTGVLSATGTVVGSPSTQAQQSSTGTITLVRTLTGTTTVQASTSTTGTVSAVQNLSGANSVQSNASQATSITSATVHNLGAVVTVTANATGTASVTQVQVLTGQASTVSNASTGAAISAVHIVTGTSSVQGNTATTGLLGAVATLVGAINTQGNSTPTQAITQVQNLVAAAVNQGKVSGTGVVGQVQFLIGTPTTQSKTAGVGSIVIGALITIGDVNVTVKFDPYDVQVNSEKYAVSVSNETYAVSVVTRRA